MKLFSTLLILFLLEAGWIGLLRSLSLLMVLGGIIIFIIGLASLGGKNEKKPPILILIGGMLLLIGFGVCSRLGFAH